MSFAPNFKVFVLGHKEDSYNIIPKKKYLQYVDLSKLRLPIENTNHLAENRIFLADESLFENTPDYIGVLTASYEKKYQHLVLLENLPQIETLLQPNTIVAADITSMGIRNWFNWSCDYHSGEYRYFLEELAKISGLNTEENDTFWANNFICHKEVFLEYTRFFKRVFEIMHKKHGYKMSFNVEDPSRIPAYLYERLTMMYFSNRKDLTKISIPHRNTFLNDILWIGFANKNYNAISRIWFESLKRIGVKEENIQFTKYEIPNSINSSIKFASETFKFCTTKKTELILKSLKDFKDKKYKFICYSDCDIQFFRGKELSWHNLMARINVSGADIFYTRELNDFDEINTGLFIARADRINDLIPFYEKVLQEMRKRDLSSMPFGDQTVVEENKKLLNFEFISGQFCISGNNFLAHHRHDFLFHHAVCAYNESEKLQQLKKMSQIIGEAHHTLFVYKNYKKDKEVLHSIKTLLKCCSTYDVHCICFYDDDQSELDQVAKELTKLGVFVHKVLKKYYPFDNQEFQKNIHLCEFINVASKIFKDEERVVLLDEFSFFKNGKCIDEILINNWDFAFGFFYGNIKRGTVWRSVPGQTVNSKILGVNFKNYPNVFPIYESEESPEISLGYLIHDRIKSLGGKIHSLQTRNYLEYSGDGCYTDNYDEMIKFK